MAYFPAIPGKVRPQLQEIIARSIKRALNQQLAQLEIKADELMEQAHGRGKSGRGRDDSASSAMCSGEIAFGRCGAVNKTHDISSEGRAPSSPKLVARVRFA